MKDFNNYSRNKVFRKYLVAGIVSSAAILLGPIFIRFIAGNFLSGTELSAINLAEPIQRVFSALISLLTSGAIVIASFDLSRIDDKSASKVFSFSIFFCTAIGLVMALSVPLSHDWMAHLLCKSEELMPTVSSYLRILLFSAPFLLVFPALAAFISLDGSPKYSYIIIGISQLLSIGIACAMIFLGLRDIASIALANLLGNAVGCILGIYFFVRRSAHFKFTVKPLVWTKATGVLKLGAPEMLSPFLDAVLVFAANAKAVELYGASGADVMAVCLSMMYIFALIIESFSLTLKPFGSYLMGIEDLKGYGRFFKINILLQQVTIFLVLIPMFLFPRKIMMLFGIDAPETLELGVMAFPIFVLHYFFCGFVELYTCNFQILNKIKFSFAIGLSQTVFRIIFVILFAKIAPDIFWWSYPLGIAAGIVVLILCLFIPKLADRRIETWTGASFVEANSCKVFSVKCTVQDLKQKLYPINDYISSLDIGDSLKDKCEHCVEEVLLNTVLFADMNHKEQHTTDIKIIEKSDAMNIIFYDDGVRFNPFDNIVPEVDTGLDMVKKLCSDVSYTYLFKQNIVNISIKAATSKITYTNMYPPDTNPTTLQTNSNDEPCQ